MKFFVYSISCLLFICLSFNIGNTQTIHDIQVGGSLGNNFDPEDITIVQGDMIRWTNDGGFHNVQTNGSQVDDFRCANGCDGDGGNGNPSSSSWTVTRTFNTVGVINYFCSPHQGSGMTGTITVEAPAQTIHDIQVGGSLGNNFDPEDITIVQGDMIRWTNDGGFHNVQTNGSQVDDFRCANGCDGDGGNGNPSSSSWTVTRTFNTVGVINYFCSPHQGSGMTGTITVEAAPAAAVDWVDFSVKPAINGQININWSTSSEIDSDYFIIERSEDGKNFTEIARQTAKGVTSQVTKYSYIDMVKTKNIYYYRVQEVAMDGKMESTNIKSVLANLNAVYQLNAYPNPLPSGSILTVELGELSEEEVILELFNVNGQSVTQQTFPKGNNVLLWQLPQLAIGTYLVELKNNKQVMQQKIIITE